MSIRKSTLKVSYDIEYEVEFHEGIARPVVLYKCNVPGIIASYVLTEDSLEDYLNPGDTYPKLHKWADELLAMNFFFRIKETQANVQPQATQAATPVVQEGAPNG